MPTKAEIEKENARLRATLAERDTIDQRRKDQIADLQTQLDAATDEPAAEEQETEIAALRRQIESQDQIIDGLNAALETRPELPEIRVQELTVSDLQVSGSPFLIFTERLTGEITYHPINLTVGPDTQPDDGVRAILTYRNIVEKLIRDNPAMFAAGAPAQTPAERTPANRTTNPTPAPQESPPPQNPTAIQDAADRLAGKPERPAEVNRANPTVRGNGPPPGMSDSMTFEGWHDVDEIHWDFKQGTPPERRTTDFFLVVRCFGKFSRHGVLAYSDTNAIPARIREAIAGGKWADKDPKKASNASYPQDMKKVAVVKDGEYYKVFAFA